MTEEELKKLPLNDEFTQCLEKLRTISSPTVIKKRKREMRKCNHLFVLLKKGGEFEKCHPTNYIQDNNIVECVHCGLTNKFMDLEKSINSLLSFSGIVCYGATLESSMFRKIFEHSCRKSGIEFNNSVLNLISDEVLKTNHPELLYRLALKINPDASNEEIFEIMEKLHLLENDQEKLRLQNKEQAEELLSRYYNSKPKVLLKK